MRGRSAYGARAMGWLRRTLRDHRHVAALLVALALAIKALVPAGYMLSPQTTVLTVTVCADASGASATKQIVVPHDGKSQGDSHAKGEACGWSSLAMGALGGADIALLALALAFIVALGFAPVSRPLPRRAKNLRPPLRGPPALT